MCAQPGRARVRTEAVLNQVRWAAGKVVQRHLSHASMSLLPKTSLPADLQGGPHFMPDATRGVVRFTGSDDLQRAGVRAIVVNGFHLMMKPGISTVHSLGGVKALLNWPGAVVTDSGGFQAYSLVRENRRNGRIDNRGLTIIPESGGKKLLLTPAKAIQNQLRLGSDILFCLDDCTHPDDSIDVQSLSVQRTVEWARSCKMAFETGLDQRGIADTSRPRLYGVIQGGRSPQLRRQCAEALLEMGFDGFGYGGWPVDESGALLHDMLALTRELVPAQYPMHALGVGHPGSVVACARLGYMLFDSALPTRDARRGRLYTFKSDKPEITGTRADWFEMIYIDDKHHLKSRQPLSTVCDGICCTGYSRGYLHHLKRLEEGLFYRLATVHNLTFMSRLTSLLRIEAQQNRAYAEEEARAHYAREHH
jgi:queuine tRNA-ribosyltransferase